MRCHCREIEHGSADYQESVVLRNRVLREPLGLEFTAQEQAEDRESIHLAAWLGDVLAGCLVLTPLSEHVIRMRQVAVSEELQGQGIGGELVRCSEHVAADHGYGEMMLHARETVVPFYDRLGYIVRGDVFIEVTIPHQEMFKRL